MEGFPEGIFPEIGANDAETAGIVRTSLPDFIFAGRQVKVQPGSFGGGQHAFGPQNRTVGVSLRQFLKNGLQLVLFILVRSLDAPAGKYFVGMMVAVMVVVMMMLVVMAAAGAGFAVLMMVLMMMFVFMLVLMVMAVFMLMVMLVVMSVLMFMVMLLAFMMMAAAALSVMVMVFMFMIMLMAVFQLLEKLCRQVLVLFHSLTTLTAA